MLPIGIVRPMRGLLGNTGLHLLLSALKTPRLISLIKPPSLNNRLRSHSLKRRFVIGWGYMVIRDQIRERLIDYLADSLSFEQFEDWLIDHSWDMHQGSPQDAQEMVLDIKEVIYQYLDRCIDEHTLKQRLQPLIASTSATVTVGQEPSFNLRLGSTARAGSQVRVSASHQAAFAQ